MQFAERETVVDPQYLQFVGQRTGLVKGLYETVETREAPRGQMSQPIPTNVGYLAGADGQIDLAAGGKGRSVEQSFMSSIGELVERYCMCFPPAAEDLVEASYTELSARHPTVDFAYLDIYDEWTTEHRLDEFDRETPIYWTIGRNLLTGEEVYVPAELVWLDVGPIEDQTHFIGTSNGTAAGSSLTSALVGSILETVERDGFMRTWCRQEVPSAIDYDQFPDLSDVLADIENEHISTTAFFYDSPVDIPTVGAVTFRRDGELPAFILGGDADPDPVEAIEHALVETVQGWPYVAEIAIDKGIGDLEPGDPNDNFEANVLYYALEEHVDEVQFLLDGDPAPLDGADTSDWDESAYLDYCLSALDAAGMTPIAFDLTTRDVMQTDLRATKVYVPELLPLTPPFALPSTHPAFAGEDVTDKPHPYP
jgi:thiazole/oxazole-forming peptide maturase SagD family component